MFDEVALPNVLSRSVLNIATFMDTLFRSLTFLY